MKKLSLFLAAIFLLGTTIAPAIDSPLYINALGVPSRVVAGDLDNDGDQDIAWITSDTDTLYTMLGNGNGGFATRRARVVPANNLTSLAMGNFNSNVDGNLDIVVTNMDGAAASNMVFFGNGTGLMGSAVSLPAFTVGAADVAVADFDPSFLCISGCYLDVAVTAPATGNLVGVYFGDGAGNFSGPFGVATGGTTPTAITAYIPIFFFFGAPAHLAVSNEGSGNVGIILSNGNQTFQTGVPIGSGLDNGVAWGDLNGDGFLDIASARAGTGVRVYLGTDGTFVNYAAGMDLTSSAQHYADVSHGDFNGDGLVDLAAVSDDILPGSEGLVTFFLSSGSGSFQAGMDDTTLLPHSSCEAVDINGNFFPDLLVGTQTSGRDSAAVYNFRAPILNPDLSSLGTPAAGANFRLPAGTATDSSLVASLKLVYRQMGKTDYDTLNFNLGAGTTVRSFGGALGPPIPASAMTNRGLEYAILSSDGFITERQPRGNNFYRLRTSVNQNAPSTASRTYQLVSFPFAVNPPTALAQIADNFSLTDSNVARLFWWDPVLSDTTSDTSSLNGYREFGSAGFPNFIPGRSMFLATNGSRVYNGTGLSTLPDTLGITPEYSRLIIDSGWNMIATPYPYTVDFDSIDILLPDSSFHELDVIRQNAIGFGSTYLRERTAAGYIAPNPPLLKPWKGYFLKNNTDSQVVLLFPKQDDGFPATAPPAPKAIAAGLDWKIDITAKSGEIETPPTTLGTSNVALREYDRLDWELPPALPGDLRVVFQRGKDFGQAGDYLTDIRTTLTESETWGFTVEPGGTRAIELNFDGLAEVPEDYDVILADKEGRAKQNLRLEPVYRLIASQDRHFELTVAPKTTGQTALLPTKYDLHQNFPNPFNPQTLIKYDLPEAAEVRLEVFNILGQKVTTLVNRFEAAGPKSVVWNGTDAAGNKVSSGIYLYKISTDDFSATKKMMLVK